MQLRKCVRTNAHYVELGRVRTDKRATKPVWSHVVRSGRISTDKGAANCSPTSCTHNHVVHVCVSCMFRCGSAALRRIIN